MKNDSNEKSPDGGVNGDAVFAALDKVVADTSLDSAPVGDASPPDVTSSVDTGSLLGPAQPAPLGFFPREQAHTPERVRHVAGQQPDIIIEEVPYLGTPKATAARQPWTPARIAIIALSAIAAVEFFLLVGGYERQPVTPDVVNGGTVTVQSTTPGATITIDGQDQGKTPSTLALHPGRYALSIVDGTVTRQFPLTVPDGSSHTQIYFEAAAAPPPSTGSASSPAATERPGISPAASAPSPATTPPANAVGGWVSVDSPIDVQLFEGGALIGSSQVRVMLPVGRHVLTAVNSTLGYKDTVTAQVAAGAVATLRLPMPMAPVNINAVPWAEVSVDGKPQGTTPLGNLSLPIGPHQFVFVHPQLGERRQTGTVTLVGANRFSANLNQP